jgi:ribosomal protein S27E
MNAILELRECCQERGFENALNVGMLLAHIIKLCFIQSKSFFIQVQCDDCDKWYHVSCVGCRYEQVQDEHTEFHCGCR